MVVAEVPLPDEDECEVVLDGALLVVVDDEEDESVLVLAGALRSRCGAVLREPACAEVDVLPASALPSGAALCVELLPTVVGNSAGSSCVSVATELDDGSTTAPPPVPPASGEIVLSSELPAPNTVTASPASAATPAATAPTFAVRRRFHLPSRCSSSTTGMRSVGVSSMRSVGVSSASTIAGNSSVKPSRRKMSATVTRCS